MGDGSLDTAGGVSGNDDVASAETGSVALWPEGACPVGPGAGALGPADAGSRGAELAGAASAGGGSSVG